MPLKWLILSSFRKCGQQHDQFNVVKKKKETLSQYEYFNNLNRSTFRLEYKICQASDVRIIKGDKRQELVLQD